MLRINSFSTQYFYLKLVIKFKIIFLLIVGDYNLYIHKLYLLLHPECIIYNSLLMDSKNHQLTLLGQIIQNKQFTLIYKLLSIFVFKISHNIISVSKKTPCFQKSLAKNIKDKAFEVLKIKKFAFVNDCFQNENNAVFGVFLQRLITTFSFYKLAIVDTNISRLMAETVSNSNTSHFAGKQNNYKQVL